MTQSKCTNAVRKAQHGDRDAFSYLYEQTHDKLYFLALKLLGNEQDALDAVQDAYISAFQRLDKLEDVELFSTWINHITANRCVDLLRKRKNIQSAQEELSGEDRTEETDENFLPHSCLDNAETRRMVMDIINSLTDDQRSSILLYYYEEMPVKDIASTLAVSDNVVKQRLFAARKNIKKAVQALEKKGLKLYAMSAIVEVPVLTQLLRKAAEETPMDTQKSKEVLDHILSALGAAGGIAGAAKSILAKIGHSHAAQIFKAATLVQKAVTIAVACAVVGSGTVGIAAATQVVSAKVTAAFGAQQAPVSTPSDKTVELNGVAATDLAFGADTPDTLNFTVNDTKQLSAAVSPANATNQTVTWASSNSQVVSVDATGKLTAVQAGDAAITATVSAQVASTTLDVQTKAKGQAWLVGDKGSVKLSPVSNTALTWLSSDTAVASIDANGNIKALHTGETTIAANAASPVSKQIQVHVAAPTPPAAPATTSTNNTSTSSVNSSKSSGKSSGGSKSSGSTGNSISTGTSGGSTTTTTGNSGGGSGSYEHKDPAAAAATLSRELGLSVVGDNGIAYNDSTYGWLFTLSCGANPVQLILNAWDYGVPDKVQTICNYYFGSSGGAAYSAISNFCTSQNHKYSSVIGGRTLTMTQNATCSQVVVYWSN